MNENKYGSDITMCKGIGCKLRFGCYRFNAIPDEYQYYFIESPVKDNNGVQTCGYFWATEEFKEIERKNARKEDR